MNGFDIQIIGADAFAHDLDVAAVELPLKSRLVTEKSGRALRDGWRANAKATSGAHGKPYPLAITDESVVTFAGATVDIGPVESILQGGMGEGFEYGSVNQEPHLDGKRAADVEGPKFLAELEVLVGRLL